MTVETTHFGTFAIVTLAAALGAFMITSAGRGVRRGRTPGTSGEQQGQTQQPPPTGQKPTSAGTRPPEPTGIEPRGRKMNSPWADAATQAAVGR